MKLSVIGLGKLGLPLLALLAKSGNKVLGYDKDVDLLARLESKRYEFSEPGLNELLTSHSKNFEFVDSLERAVKESDVIFVIVPTPSDSNNKFSNIHIYEVIEEFSKAIKNKKEFCILNIVSTVMPNSCDREFIPRIEATSGKKINIDFGLTYNPEFIALGSVIQDMEYPDMHLIGSSDANSGEVIQKILHGMSKNSAPSMIMNLTEAEVVKISVNNFVTMKISFANMLMQLANSLKNVNVDTITNAIGLDSRVGKKYLRAGTAYGGPCFPRDTRAMSALFIDYDLANSLPTAVGELNNSHSNFLASEIENVAQELINSKIGIIGLSYKEGSYVLDESTSILLARRLRESGFEVLAWDSMSHLMNSNLLKDILVSDSIQELLQEIEFVILPRTISQRHLNQVLNWDRSLTIFDPWGQIADCDFGIHRVLQPGRIVERHTRTTENLP